MSVGMLSKLGRWCALAVVVICVAIESGPTTAAGLALALFGVELVMHTTDEILALLRATLDRS